MKKNIKKGFTFAELMVSLVVIAVITAILYPTISELAPNNNKHLFKSAYKTIEMVMADITSTNRTGSPKTIKSIFSDAEELCVEFREKLNVFEDFCSADPAALTTSNGMRWIFRREDILKTGTTSTDYLWIIVDVNASNNKIPSKLLTGRGSSSSSSSASSSSTSGSGSSLPWSSGSFIGNDTTTDTFGIQVSTKEGEEGKILGVSPEARRNLLEESVD